MTKAFEWPGRLAAERAWGAFGDALGLKPARAMAETLEQLGLAQADEFAAFAAFAQMTMLAVLEAMACLPAGLEAHAAANGLPDSPVVPLRVWFAELDRATHRAMLSDAGLAATAAAVRATARRRLQAQRAVALGAEAIGAPTQAGVDDAYREIQQLKRALRRLEAAVHAGRKDTA